MTEPVYLSVRLPLKIGPMERFEFWEEPLTEILKAEELGEITGGGTMMDPEGDILYCDLEVELSDLTDKTLDKLQDAMTRLNAPKSTSFVTDGGTVLREFGSISVVGIGLNGADLPDSAYEGFDPDDFNDEVVSSLGEGYAYGGSHAGEKYTFFYYHGSDADHMKTRLTDIAAHKPIGEGAQITQLA
ncbi:hypothetical protein SLH49_12805 [Cognatiyoonia sp. IB215446]|uniref:hypothetical protein n=1 Tax=Cognatiyoonia sp. IB215446 TaxID=3097355 RepID=UPI002A16C6F3|nr:hypothetical protein [Cognatiyoonia sp. IB215446]MDX8348860.1 hypothetical protein [Cognatiyoonia sp. IB215446]